MVFHDCNEANEWVLAELSTRFMSNSNGDGWVVGHLDDYGFDSSPIFQMMSLIEDGTFVGIDSISLARNNTLVLMSLYDRQFDEFDDWVGINTAVTSYPRAYTVEGFGTPDRPK